MLLAQLKKYNCHAYKAYSVFDVSGSERKCLLEDIKSYFQTSTLSVSNFEESLMKGIKEKGRNRFEYEASWDIIV